MRRTKKEQRAQRQKDDDAWLEIPPAADLEHSPEQKKYTGRAKKDEVVAAEICFK
jgi:hypothetical protein